MGQRRDDNMLKIYSFDMSGEFFGDSGREQITYDLQYFNSAVGQGSLLRRSCLTF